MSDKITILKNSACSVDSQNVDNKVNLEINRTEKKFIHSSEIGVVDANEQFINERNSCTDYRLILTINPYCTNVLFNSCTEVVKNEGSDKPIVITADDGFNITERTVPNGKVYGKETGLRLYDMVRNTEYSREDIGFEYHPGYDFFNNHILRNKSFRIVNPIKNSESVENKNKFNTIEDYMRLANGDRLQKCCRIGIDDTKFKDKHLYDYDDVLSFRNGDALKENLREENGWFGFYNTSVISSKDLKGNDMDISRAINSKGNCDFVDMYPDRSLFSFKPKYNKYLNRMEENWSILLTYPFAKTTKYTYCTNRINSNGVSINCQNEADFELIQSGNVNALLVAEARYVISGNGLPMIQFRSFTKHNLKENDSVTIYFSEDMVPLSSHLGEEPKWHKTMKPYVVSGVGDVNGEYKEYYFRVRDNGLLNDIFATSRHVKESHFDETTQQIVIDSYYTAWDYVRDYFYKEVTQQDNISDAEFQITYDHHGLTNIPSVRDAYIRVVTYDIADNITPSSFNTGTYYIRTGDHRTYEYNIASSFVDGETYYTKSIKKYQLYNHDVNESYTDVRRKRTAEDFIRGIVNNAFIGEDGIERDENTVTLPGANWSDYITFRFAKSNGITDCQYYVRKFRPLVNEKLIKHKVGEEIKYDYDEHNPIHGEKYQLGYAGTVYGDSVSQIVFTDSIKTDKMTDNLGRDISEIYATVIKTNKGHNKWYTDNASPEGREGYDDVEFSHAFGKVTCGFKLFGLDNDSEILRRKRHELADVTMINNNGVGPSSDKGMNTVGNDEDLGKYAYDTEHNFFFYGDIVEFNPVKYTETVICDVNFRFNTAQRELMCEDNYCFIYDELEGDDFDKNGFKVVKYSDDDSDRFITKPEGYYYKAHYPIKVMGNGHLIQATHMRISAVSAEPVQLDGIYIQIESSMPHGLKKGDKILLCDNTETECGTTWILDVVSVSDRYTFVMTTIKKSETVNRYRDWITVCSFINEGTYTIKKLNQDIPDYAVKVNNGTFVWRNPVKLWDSSIPENERKEPVYSNNAIYLEETINFYLRRQDPNNINSLNTTYDIPYLADPEGKVLEGKSDFEYNDPEFAEC